MYIYPSFSDEEKNEKGTNNAQLQETKVSKFTLNSEGTYNYKVYKKDSNKIKKKCTETKVSGVTTIKDFNKIKKYRILGKKGEGTFSEVLKCQHVKDGTYYACKKMKQRYDGVEQVNNLREIQAMRRLNPHTNIIGLHEIIYDKKTGTVALICELMDMNIYEMIRGRRHYLPEQKIKSYMYQLLKSIDHMHRCGIFHRDVKPENILVKDEVLKLADFGSCRSVYSKPPYTEYISTRWYRAPECLLTDGYYSYRMDLWSVGCVFFEVMSLHPLFPGSNEVDQIAKIHDVLGTPDASILNKMKHRNRGINFDFPPKKGTGIEKLIPHASQHCIELIYKMCTYDPDERITAKQALRHPYFRDFRELDKKKTTSKTPLVTEQQMNKKQNQTHESWRQAQIQKKREKQNSPKKKLERLPTPKKTTLFDAFEDLQDARSSSEDSMGLVRGIIPNPKSSEKIKTPPPVNKEAQKYPIHKTTFNRDKMSIEPQVKFYNYPSYDPISNPVYKLSSANKKARNPRKADSKALRHERMNRELKKKRTVPQKEKPKTPKFRFFHRELNPNYGGAKPVPAQQQQQEPNRDFPKKETSNLMKKARPNMYAGRFDYRTTEQEKAAVVKLPMIFRPEKTFDVNSSQVQMNPDLFGGLPSIENKENLKDMQAESSKNKISLEQMLLRRQRRLAEQQQKSNQQLGNSFVVKNNHQPPSFNQGGGPKSVYSSSLPKVHNYKLHPKVGNHLPRHQFAHHQPSSNMMLPGILKTNPILGPHHGHHGNKAHFHGNHANTHLHHKTKIKKEPKSLYGQHYQLPSINRQIYR